jgi:anthranilate/para-aminobenzoate synthase component I
VDLNLSKKKFLESICQDYGSIEIPPLYIEIPYQEPYRIYEKMADGKEGILLESVKGPYKIARYSFIAWDPYLVVKAKNGEVLIKGDSSALTLRDPLKKIKELVRVYPQKKIDELPPFHGGAVGLISYDYARYIERLPEKSINDINIPDVHFILVDKVFAFDHMLKKAWLILSPGVKDTELGYRDINQIDWNRAYDSAEGVLGEIYERTRFVGSIENSEKNFSQIADSIIYEMKKEDYIEIVKRAKEYIAAGDIFQANLSQRIRSFIGDLDPWSVYKVLRRINPSPFAAYADFIDYKIVSSSPERLVMVRDRVIETRPIAGTRPRGRDLKEDEMMRAELLLNEKERAEHIMLIDLERNDIGKVSKYGSVEVDELMITEDYSHVIHIVSNIKGILKNDKDCFDAIRAVFPGGTITGVPKVRCMEIIEELEPVRRACYTGSLGYIGFSGSMDMNIIIRSFLIKDGYAYVQAGAGIVADSDPEREYYETLKKAEALIKTLKLLG